MHFSQRKADPCTKLSSWTLLQHCRLSLYRKARNEKSWQRTQRVSSTDRIPAAGSRAGVKQAYSAFKEQTQGEKGKENEGTQLAWKRHCIKALKERYKYFFNCR